MKTVILPFGKGNRKITLPDKLNYSVLSAPHIKPISNIESAINKSLDMPIGSKLFNQIFKATDKIAIIIPDKTRRCRTDKILPVIVSRLIKLGVSYRQITIILARGIHSAHNREEIKKLVSNKVFNKIKVIDHDSKNNKELAYIGATSYGTRVEINRYAAEANKIITIGVIQYHYFAGFSGGRKAIVPGIAGYQTINQNHSLVLNRHPPRGKNPLATLGRLDGNPVHEDMTEAVRMTGVDFAINLVVNHYEQVLKIFSGHIIKSHFKSCKFLDKSYLVHLKKPVDLIIASAGGYPTDMNFIQAHKTLEHTSKALKENGKMVVLAECAEGVGSNIFRRWLGYTTLEKMETMLRKKFLVSGHTALCSMIKAKRFDIYLYSKLDKATVKKMCFTPIGKIQPVIDRIISDLPSNARVLVLTEGYSLVPVIMK